MQKQLLIVTHDVHNRYVNEHVKCYIRIISNWILITNSWIWVFQPRSQVLVLSAS